MLTKKITLINPPWYFSHPRNIIFPNNLGIGYLAAYLESQGVQVTVVDSLATDIKKIIKIRGRYNIYYQVGLTYLEIVDRIPGDSDFIGVSAPFTNHARIVKDLACVIKSKFPQVPIIVGGACPSISKDSVMSESIDYYIEGEGEKQLFDLISGINSSPAQIAEDLDTLPFPKRDKLSMCQYSQRRERIKGSSMITSRGCPFDCDFCSIHLICGRKWRSRSSENVLDEIKYLINEFDIQHIEFEDDNLTLDKERAIRIFEGIEAINRTGKTFSWSTPNGVRVDSLDKSMLALIKRSGCSSLSFGVESGDPKILKCMKKQLDLDKVVEAVRICIKLSLRTNIFLMIGYPGEDKDSFFKTLEFVRKLKKEGADVFYPGITRAYPGTDLFNFCQKKGYLPLPEAREDIFLDNIITLGNAIITPDFNSKELRKRFVQVERLTVPLNLRLYHRYFHIVKKIIPDWIIQNIKLFLR